MSLVKPVIAIIKERNYRVSRILKQPARIMLLRKAKVDIAERRLRPMELPND
jgi:hypothetical protein